MTAPTNLQNRSPNPCQTGASTYDNAQQQPWPIFGPHEIGGACVFVAAFSREEVDPFRSLGRRYASFNRARDDFRQRLDVATPFKVGGFVPLDNAILGDPAVTTGDHDGVAVLVRAK